jgi:hypothetical protein
MELRLGPECLGTGRRGRGEGKEEERKDQKEG